MYFIEHCFICRPLDSIVSEDPGTLTKDCCDHFWQRLLDAQTTRLELIQN
jgi:hypothetical protein